MDFLQRFPWITFGLLAIAYGMVGLTLSTLGFTESWSFEVTMNSLVLVMVAFLSFPLQSIRQAFMKQWQKNSGILRSIVLTTGLSIIGIFLLVQTRFLAYVCIVLSATMMARLDLQSRKVPDWVSFAVLSACAIVFLNLGWNWSFIRAYLNTLAIIPKLSIQGLWIVQAH